MITKFDLIISVVNYNGEAYIGQCLDYLIKICKKSQKKIFLICIDNNSSDLSRRIINSYNEIKKIYLKQNIGYAAAHNEVLKKYDSKYFLLLNPDVLIKDESNIDTMLNYMDNYPNIAISTCSIIDENNDKLPSIAHLPKVINGIVEQFKFIPGFRYRPFLNKIIVKLSKVFPSVLSNYDPVLQNINKPAIVELVYGAYLFLRKSALLKIGIFDENYFLFWEEIDLCIRARKLGFFIGYNPNTFIIHKYQKSQMSAQELSYFFRIASYFWIFKKYYPCRFILWSISVSLLQPFFIVINLFKNKKRWMKIHYLLFQLSISFGKRYESFLIKFKNGDSTLI